MQHVKRPFKYDGDLIFNEIHGEILRTYMFFKEGVSVEVQVSNVTHLCVSENGHRLYSEVTGLSHYIPKGWLSLAWVVQEDS